MRAAASAPSAAAVTPPAKTPGTEDVGRRSLPESWRAAIAICPFCRGVQEDDMRCAHCNGSGDLMGVLLLDAYARGRQHVIDGLQEVEAVRRLAVEKLQREQPTADELKRSMGL